MQNQLTEALTTLKQLKEKSISTNMGVIQSVVKTEGGWRVLRSIDSESKPLQFDNKSLIKWVENLEYDYLFIAYDSAPSVTPAITPQQQEVIKPITSLSCTRMETIEKLKVDANYIRQANAICQASNSLISLTSLHLKILKNL
jgi:hypothetical protein